MSGQKFRLLFEYLTKTHSVLILSEAAVLELRGHVRRQFRERTDALAKATRDAHALGVAVELTEIDADAVYREAYERWEAETGAFVRRSEVRKLPLDNSILTALVIRAAERVPPVRPDGRETRDAIIWLSFLAFLRQQPKDEVAFISANTRDFAVLDGTALRTELQEEVAAHAGGVRYYRNLDEFNRAHAEPIAHITREWLAARIDQASVHELIDHFVERVLEAGDFRVASMDERELYRPYAIEHLYTPEAELEDVFVWRASGERLELSLDYRARVEAELACERIPLPYPSMRSDEHQYFDQTRPPIRTLTGSIDALVTVSAVVERDAVTLGAVEGVVT